MSILFKELMGIIDSELKAKPISSVRSIPDTGRPATQSQVAKWTNLALGTLSSMNDLFWKRIESFTPATTTNYLEVPFFWKRLERITISGMDYLVGTKGDLTRTYYTDGDNIVRCRTGSFSAGVEIFLTGVFRPSKVKDCGEKPVDSTLVAQWEIDVAESLESRVDFPEDHLECLKLKILLSYAGREKQNMTQWYAQYNMAKTGALAIFLNAEPPVPIVGRFRNPIAFYRRRR
jgi:hypothetical protein